MVVPEAGVALHVVGEIALRNNEKVLDGAHYGNNGDGRLSPAEFDRASDAHRNARKVLKHADSQGWVARAFRSAEQTQAIDHAVKVVNEQSESSSDLRLTRRAASRRDQEIATYIDKTKFGNNDGNISQQEVKAYSTHLHTLLLRDNISAGTRQLANEMLERTNRLLTRFDSAS